MTKRSEELETQIEGLKNQHSDLRVSNSYDLLRVSGLLNKHLDIGYRKTKLKRIQVMTLSFILGNGGTMTPTELKSKVFRSDNAICKSLDNLDRLGLTRSSRTKTDRRLRRVTLTEKGLEVTKKILPIRRTLFAQAASPLTQEENEELQRILQKLSDHLLEITGKKPKTKEDKFYF
jgi:DNA-binding MarR family transcriptional regulator